MNMASGSEQGGEDNLLTSEQVAELLAIKVSTLRQWRHKKTGPGFVRVGRFVRYSRADLNDYLERNRSTP